MPDSSLPTLRKVQDALGRFKYITVLDLADSYHQFGIKKKDQVKTVFTWGKHGQLMFKGVPFGLKIMIRHAETYGTIIRKARSDTISRQRSNSINGCRTTQKRCVRSIRSFDV